MPLPKGKHRPQPDDYSDPTLPELLYYIVELKSRWRGEGGGVRGGGRGGEGRGGGWYPCGSGEGRGKGREVVASGSIALCGYMYIHVCTCSVWWRVALLLLSGHSVHILLLLLLLLLLFLLAAILRKHERVVQNYFLRYMGGYDAQLMRDVVMVTPFSTSSDCLFTCRGCPQRMQWCTVYIITTGESLDTVMSCACT